MRGFTLLEMIVTLVIVSLLVVVLVQALSQALRIRSGIITHQRLSRIALLQEQWFRDSVAGSIADARDAPVQWIGGTDSMKFLTLAPLTGAGLQEVAWTLQPVAGGKGLHYVAADGRDLEVIPGPLKNASFAYMDGTGVWHREWKPRTDDKHVLPRVVRLEAETASGTLLWLAPVVADAAAPTIIPLGDAANGGI